MDISLTKPQYEMYQMLENSVQFPAFVGGFGCGKSHILILNVIRDLFSFTGAKVAVYAPTFDLLRLNILPRLESFLEDAGIKYQTNKSEYIIRTGNDNQIILRSMNNPEKIVAYEVYSSHIDEADLLPTVEKSEIAWMKILGRTRQINPNSNKHFNQVSAYSTPEGYGFLYNRWGKNKDEKYKYVQAPTSSNPYIDQSYIDNLMSSYTPEQQKAYLNGEFVNLKTGSVYSYFDRNRHHSDRVILEGDKLYISVDFNIGGSCGAVYVKDTDGYPIMVDEFCVHDTREMAEYINENYNNHTIVVFPDATGKKNTTNATSSDIDILKGSGLRIRAKKTNPLIVNRVNSVQRLLYNNYFKINTNKCPESTDALEQQAYSRITGKPDKFSGAGTIDDRNDAMGYFVSYTYPIREKTITTTKFTGF